MILYDLCNCLTHSNDKLLIEHLLRLLASFNSNAVVQKLETMMKDSEINLINRVQIRETWYRLYAEFDRFVTDDAA